MDKRCFSVAFGSRRNERRKVKCDIKFKNTGREILIILYLIIFLMHFVTSTYIILYIKTSCKNLIFI